MADCVGVDVTKPKARPVACESCGAQLPPSERLRRFCDQRCSDQAYRDRNREKHNAYNAEWQRNNRDRRRAANQRYAETHREEIRARARAKGAEPGVWASRWQRKQDRLGRDAALEEIRAHSLKRRFGLTPAEYDDLLARQGGGCAICGKTPEQNGRRLPVDHDHSCCPDRYRTCGRCIRGVLCTPCNNRLGVLEDATWVAAATVYLGVSRKGRQHDR